MKDQFSSVFLPWKISLIWFSHNYSILYHTRPQMLRHFHYSFVEVSPVKLDSMV